MIHDKYIQYIRTTVLEEFEEPYSDETLINAINVCSSYVRKFEAINLYFSWASDDEYDLYITLSTKLSVTDFYRQYGNIADAYFTISIKRFSIWECEPDEAQAYARRIKRMLKKAFPDKIISSRLRLK